MLGVVLGAQIERTDAAEDNDEAVTTARAAQEPSEPMEEVLVQEPRLQPDRIRALSEMLDAYKAHERGGKLYRQHKYSEALPYLLTAAKEGFKTSQFRLAYLYRHGLGGVEYDAEVAIGWLGTAARGNTTPEIRNTFNRIWKRVPEHYIAYVTSIIDYYDDNYSSETNRLSCRMQRKLGTHIKRMSCFYLDEHIYNDYDGLIDQVSPDTAPPPPLP